MIVQKWHYLGQTVRAFGIEGGVYVDRFLFSFLNPRIQHALISKSVFPEVMKTIWAGTILGMHHRRYQPALNMNTGHLIRNVAYNSSTKGKGRYEGNLFVKSVVPYSRIHELGGVVRRKFTYTGPRGGKRTKTVEAIYIRRKYLFQPAEEYAFEATAKFYSKLLSKMAGRGAVGDIS
jgi:hypothetical protein